MSDDNCNFCGLPREDHEQCPECGYTWCDVQMRRDHYMCGKPQPKPPKAWALILQAKGLNRRQKGRR